MPVQRPLIDSVPAWADLALVPDSNAVRWYSHGEFL